MQQFRVHLSLHIWDVVSIWHRLRVSEGHRRQILSLRRILRNSSIPKALSHRLFVSVTSNTGNDGMVNDSRADRANHHINRVDPPLARSAGRPGVVLLSHPIFGGSRGGSRHAGAAESTALPGGSPYSYPESVYVPMPSRMALPLIAGLLGGLLSASPTLPKSEVIDLGYNRYQGVSLHNGVDQYLGMRYAKPPVNDLRFRAPQDPEPSSKLLDASSVRLRVPGLRAECFRVTR